MKIPITMPVFGAEELAAVQRPLQSGWVVQGPFVREFEELFAAFAGAGFAAAASSCTTALHLAMAALGLKPGDEVLVPAFTWIATANVVEYMGATPVFCDVDLDSFNLDVRELSARVTPRTVGIIPVHLFGLCADMDAVLALGRARGLWVVEDAACAFGARYRGAHAGTLGEAGCFSFHPRKAITTGEGGMVLTGSADIDRLCRTLRDHGASRSDLSRHQAGGAFLLADYDHLGYNYRMTDLQAALGVAQMGRAAWILRERTRRAAAYRPMIEQRLPWLAPPVVPADLEHGWQSYVCLFRPEPPGLHNLKQLHELRNRLMAGMEERGIATRQGTHAPVLCGYYRDRYGLRGEDFPGALLADRLSLTLPLYPQMTDAEQEEVVEQLHLVFASL